MQPIVNGLETEYAGKLAFGRRNAATPEGRAELKYYDLLGHPSYVIVAPDGTSAVERVWSCAGGPLAATVGQVCKTVVRTWSNARAAGHPV